MRADRGRLVGVDAEAPVALAMGRWQAPAVPHWNETPASRWRRPRPAAVTRARRWHARSLGCGLVALALAAGCSSPSPPAAADRPNVVLAIGDDHGYPYFGFMGDGIVRTPNLDRLAEGGVVFTTAYVAASVCEPSLRALLTGAEPFARLPRSFSEVMQPSNTLPGLLGQHGYSSFQAGKLWQPSYRRAGFTDGTKGEKLEGGGFERAMGGRAGLAVGRSTMQPVYDFIDRNERAPFLLWFAPMLPHRPWNAPEKVLARYDAVARELSPSALAYYANISRFDDALGELVDYLDRKGLRSRTLIVYLSDNGFQQGPQETFAPESLDHAKDSMAEMGFRTPIIFNWPGHIPAGVVRDDLVSSLDLFPTLLDFAGVPRPADRVGIDLRPALERGAAVPRTEIVGVMLRTRPISVGQPPKPQARRAYFVRSARWHYAQYAEEGTEQLFDLKTDPRELHDVVTDHPEEAQGFRERIERWQSERSTTGGPARSVAP